MKTAETTDSFAPPYTPTPDQIRETCREIQSEWTEQERYRRAGTTGEYELPTATDHGRHQSSRGRRLYG